MLKKLAARILQKPVNFIYIWMTWLVIEINEELKDTKLFEERAQHLKDTTFLLFEEIKNKKKK